MSLALVAQLAVAIATAGLVPWALRLAGGPRWLVVPGILAALAPLTTPWLVVPWLGVGVVCFARGVARLARRLWFPIGELGLAFAEMGVLAAAVWLASFCFGHPLLGYPPEWVILTAAHFHVAGVILPLVAGLLSRESRAAGAAVILAVLSVPMTAIGIHTSRPLELAGGLAVVAAGGLVAVVLLRRRHVVPALCLAASMVLAGSYALRGFAFDLGLPSMALSHGALNVVGFAGGALWALWRRPVPAGPEAGIPYSRLSSARFVPGVPIEAGLVDDLAELAHAGFDTRAVDPAVRRFYEHTSGHVMRVRPRWRPGFVLGGRIWAALARRLGQLQLPVAEDGTAVDSRLFAVDAAADGRSAPRAWIRRYPDGRALYKAVYSTHRRHGGAYMNIAFPLPASHLASILRMDDRPGGAIVVSTTRGDDSGIWWVLTPFGRRLPLRLPMNETIEVWPRAAAPAELAAWAPEATVIARHELWLFGVLFLRLDYAVSPR